MNSKQATVNKTMAMRSLERKQIHNTIKEVVKKLISEKYDRNHEVQRSVVWNDKEMSDLIHTIVTGFHVPEMFLLNVGGGKYYIMDGNQRLSAILKLIKGELVLTGIKGNILYESDDDGSIIEYDLNGKTWSDLPNEIKECINSYMLWFVEYDGTEMSEEHQRRLFTKINSGKKLSTKDRNIASCYDLKNIAEIGEHEFFKKLMTKAALEVNRKHISLIMKIYAMLFVDKPSFVSETFNSLMEDTIIDDDQRELINQVLNRMERLIDGIKTIADKEERVFIMKKFKTETHLIALVSVIKDAIDRNIGTGKILDFIRYFFNSDNTTSIDPDYDESCAGSTAKPGQIRKRKDAIMSAWNKFTSEPDEDDEVVFTEEEEESIRAFVDELFSDTNN